MRRVTSPRQDVTQASHSGPVDFPTSTESAGHTKIAKDRGQVRRTSQTCLTRTDEALDRVEGLHHQGVSLVAGHGVQHRRLGHHVLDGLVEVRVQGRQQRPNGMMTDHQPSSLRIGGKGKRDVLARGELLRLFPVLGGHAVELFTKLPDKLVSPAPFTSPSVSSNTVPGGEGTYCYAYLP